MRSLCQIGNNAVLDINLRKMGWIPDLPDPRDFTQQHPAATRQLEEHTETSKKIPSKVDLRYGDEGEVFFADIERTANIESSTAFVTLSMIEYYERKRGRTFRGSELFLYKVARNTRHKSHAISESGVDFRSTFKAIRQFGIPSADLWPYELSRINQEPSAFVYQSAKKLPGFTYFRLSTKAEAETKSKGTLWKQVKKTLSQGFPVAVGLSIPASITAEPNILFRPQADSYLGSMAALIIGYDIHHFGRNQGALLIRTPLGTKWGSRGNGWLPAAFADAGLVREFWCMDFGETEV